MIRILEKVTKRKKTHVKYEFNDDEGKIHVKTLVLSNDEFEELSDPQLYQRVRGQVVKVRKLKSQVVDEPDPEEGLVLEE